MYIFFWNRYFSSAVGPRFFQQCIPPTSMHSDIVEYFPTVDILYNKLEKLLNKRKVNKSIGLFVKTSGLPIERDATYSLQIFSAAINKVSHCLCCMSIKANQRAFHFEELELW